MTTTGLTQLQRVGSFEEIGICPTDHPSINLCRQRVVPGQTPDGQPNNQVMCFLGLASEFTPEYASSHDLSLSEYNDSVGFLSQNGFSQICRSAETTAPDPRYALFSPNPQFAQLAYTAVATDSTIFPVCNPQLGDANGVKRTLTREITVPPRTVTEGAFSFTVTTPPTYEPLSLNRAAAEYIVDKFPFPIDGCSTTGPDGTYYYKLAIDRGSLDGAINAIRNDISQHKLPAGVDENMANLIIGGIQRIREQDPALVQEEGVERQMEAQRDATIISIVLQVASTGVIGWFFYKQLRISQQSLAETQRLAAERAGVVRNALELYTDDMTAEYARGELEPMDLTPRLPQIRDLLVRLKANKSDALTGESGVGKTAVVEGVIALLERVKAAEAAGDQNAIANLRRMVGDDTYELVKKLAPRIRIRSLNINRMVAGCRNRGDFEGKLQAVLDEIKKSRENGVREVLFIDELHRLIGAGGADGITGADQTLKPELARGKIQIIGATTTEEYAKYIQGDRALSRRFQETYVPALTPEQTIDALMAKVPKLGAATDTDPALQIPREAVEEATKIAVEFIEDQALPGSAADVLENAVEFKRAFPGSDPTKANVLTPEDVRRYYENKQQASLFNDDDDEPPAAPATGGTTQAQGAPSGSTAAKMSWLGSPWAVNPEVTEPVSIGELIFGTPRAAEVVTPEGYTMRVAVTEETTAPASRVGGPRVSPPVDALMPSPGFVSSAGANLIFGFAGYGAIHEIIEPAIGRELNGYEKFGVYVGTGVGGSAVLSWFAGSSPAWGMIAKSVPVGFASFFPIGYSLALSESLLGIDPNSHGSEAFIIGGGGLLAAAAATAELPVFIVTAAGGVTTAAEAGATFTGLALGAGTGIAVGAAALAGVGLGLGIDHGTNWVMHKVGACEEGQDCSMSGNGARWLVEHDYEACNPFTSLSCAGGTIASPVTIAADMAGDIYDDVTDLIGYEFDF